MFRFFLFLLLLTCNFYLNAFGFNIVYPKTENVVINSDKTFFIGNENPSYNLKINNQSVNIHPSGGFKHTVYLNYGVNEFVISNGKYKKNYKITRQQIPSSVNSEKEKKFIQYNNIKFVRTSKDNSVLRSTPVDSGLNRLQHYQKDIDLRVVGEYGDFYKVKLSRDDYAWISKSDVAEIDKEYLCSGFVSGYQSKEFEDYIIYKFKPGYKYPYVINENGLSGYTLTFYDLCEESYPFGRYEFNIAQKEKNFGYSAYYNDKNELIVKINKYKNSLKNLRITIDAGHGGSELGAIGCLGDKEKDINLQIAKKLKNKLEAAGAKIYMTRNDDTYVSLNDRVKFSNDNDSQVFISIHNNALPDSLADKDASGVEVYYFYPQSRYLSKVMTKTLSKELGIKDRGSKGASFAVIRNSNSLAILIEAAFMINPDENAKLRTDEFQNKIADAIIKGLQYYFNGIDWDIVRGK